MKVDAESPSRLNKTPKQGGSTGEVDLSDLLLDVWKHKWLIVLVTLLFAFIGVVFSHSKPDVYRAEALLAPAEESQNIGGVVGQLGGLASLAGVNVSGGADKVSIGLEVLKSRAFITKFINRREILISLMAVKGWDAKTRELEIDGDKYNTETKSWVIDASSRSYKPSEWNAYSSFMQHLSVIKNKDTGFISISIQHFSPEIASKWVRWLVEDINEYLRQRDIDEAKRSVSYLKVQLDQTAVADMRRVFYQLIEKQIQTMMLANIRHQYVFKIIDPPIEPEERDGPNRALICSLMTLLGGLLGMVIVFVRYMIATSDR